MTYTPYFLRSIHSVPVCEYAMNILTSPQPTVEPFNIMTYFKFFTPLIWSLIFMSLFLVTLLLLKQRNVPSSQKRTVFSILWKLITIMLKNGSYVSKVTVHVVLMVFFLLGTSMFIRLFENSISADHTVRNESSIVDSLDDLMKHPEKVVLIQPTQFEK